MNTHQALVIDNTNPTKEERKKYITISKEKNFRVIGFYFRSNINEALERNNDRSGKERIPEIGIRGTYNKLEIPEKEEGFDELYYVELDDKRNFVIKNWDNEI